MDNEKLLYRFTPASIASNFTPLLVLFDSDENTAKVNFEYKMWNILTPILHETDSSSITESLQKLVEEIADEHGCEEHIYFYGSGLNGYRAILHGILCKANAVYAYAPHIIEDDILYSYLNTKETLPIFYLCDNQSFSRKIKKFIDLCTEHKITLNLVHCPKDEDDKNQTLKNILDMFERMTP